MKTKASKILIVILCYTLFEVNEVNAQSIYKTCTDSVASFHGGEAKLKEFINKNLIFPKIDTDIFGTVILSFVVDTSGVISQVNIEKGLYKDFDEEAIRIVKLMPKWKPANVFNINVRSIVYLKIKFAIY